MTKLLKAWGLAFDGSKVAGDIAHARRVQFGGGGRPIVTEYVGWLGLERGNLDQKDVLSGGIERLNMSTPGFLSEVDGATTRVSAILQTSPQAMQIEAGKFEGQPDPVGLLRAYKPEGKPLMLAARVTGSANSAFPDGAPKAADKQDAPADKSGEVKDQVKGAKEQSKAGAAEKQKSETTGAPPSHVGSGRIKTRLWWRTPYPVVRPVLERDARHLLVSRLCFLPPAMPRSLSMRSTIFRL